MQKWFAADILSLGIAADAARRKSGEGATVTYRRVHTVTPATLAVGEPVPEAAVELRLYDAPDSLETAIAQVRAMKALAGTRRVTAYSMEHLEDYAAAGWGRLPDVLSALVAAGLDDVAEMPADRLPDLLGALQALHTAGATPQRITVLYPVADRKQEIVAGIHACLLALGRSMHVSPLPRHAPADRPTTGYEDLRMVALTRLALGSDDRTPARIEVDWSIYGPKLAQVALTFGADHLDAVAATSDASMGRRRETVEDVERNIRAAGFEPREERE